MQTSINEKITFIMLIGRSLHKYGASSDRIEKALEILSSKLNVEVRCFSLPTGIFASFIDGDTEQARMDRLDPGKINLSKLYHVDHIVDLVTWNEITIEDGSKRVKEIQNELPLYNNLLVTLSYGLIAFAITIFLKGTLLDAGFAALLGLIVGFFTETVKEERIDSVSDAIISFLVASLALLLGSIFPLNVNLITLASLIMLVPGLMLTLAIGELASQNLTSGTARIMGAFVILLKISFGVYLGYQLVKYFNIPMLEAQLGSPSLPIEILALVLSGMGLSLSFQARKQDYIWIILAAFISFYSSAILINMLGVVGGYLVAGTVVGSLSNVFSRVKNRPALIFLLPAIILLVPGSIGFQGLGFLFDKNILEGFNSIFNMISIGISLISGTYFGAILVKPRRTL